MSWRLSDLQYAECMYHVVVVEVEVEVAVVAAAAGGGTVVGDSRR